MELKLVKTYPCNDGSGDRIVLIKGDLSPHRQTVLGIDGVHGITQIGDFAQVRVNDRSGQPSQLLDRIKNRVS